MYQIVKPVVAEVIVCNPRMNKLLAVGTRQTGVDVEKLADLPRCRQLKWLYHGVVGLKLLKELVDSYETAGWRHGRFTHGKPCEVAEPEVPKFEGESIKTSGVPVPFGLRVLPNCMRPRMTGEL